LAVLCQAATQDVQQLHIPFARRCGTYAGGFSAIALGCARLPPEAASNCTLSLVSLFRSCAFAAGEGFVIAIAVSGAVT
jgi:hypothetical protein